MAEGIIGGGRWKGIILLAAAVLWLCLPAGGLRTAQSWARESTSSGAARSLSVRSPAFPSGGRIPIRYTCDGKNTSPPLVWRGQPAGTSGFALIVDDPDAPGGGFTHWLVFNVPARVHSLPAGEPARSQLSSGGLQGRNSFGRVGYSGPCPPSGPAHHYRFTLYALDMALHLRSGSSVDQVRAAIRSQVRAQARLIGIYSRG